MTTSGLSRRGFLADAGSAASAVPGLARHSPLAFAADSDHHLRRYAYQLTRSQ